MKTQFGPNPNPTPGAFAVGKPVESSGLTEGAVKPVESPAATGEESRPPEPEVKRDKPQHPALVSNSRLTIEKDHGSGKYVYKTVHRETGEVIKQWPREKMLKAISERQDPSGLLVDKKV